MVVRFGLGDSRYAVARRAALGAIADVYPAERNFSTANHRGPARYDRCGGDVLQNQ